MTMRIPVWDGGNDLKFAVMSEGDEWTQSRFVKITESTTLLALQRAHDRMGYVQFVRVQEMKSELLRPLIELLEKSSMPNLRALSVEIMMRVIYAIRMAKALQSAAKLQQLKLLLTNVDEDKLFASFVNALSLLPLSSLCLQLFRFPSPKSTDLLVQMLKQKRETFVSLELCTGGRGDVFNTAVCKGLFGMKLRVFRLVSEKLNASQMQDLCKAIEQMPHLETLLVSCKEIATFTKYFSSASYRPIKFLDCRLTSKGIADDDVKAFFEAVKRSTRLRALTVANRSQCVLDSGLLNEGHLIHEIGSKSAHPRLVPFLERNKARHLACKRASIALIAVRRKQGVLKWIAPDIVRMIAMWLWNTRNQSLWDQR
jgi:hypothetical protein